MKCLFQEGVCICPSGHFEQLTFKNAVRTNRVVLAITLINTNSSNLIPNSAIDLRYSKSRSKVFSETYRVTSITIKDLSNNETQEVKFQLPKKKKNNKSSMTND